MFGIWDIRMTYSEMLKSSFRKGSLFYIHEECVFLDSLLC